jgi:hypothetical protein
MKLAEALLLRADVQKKVASLRDRIAKNAIIQKGDKLHEDPAKLIEEAFLTLKELETLVVRINQANLKYALPDGRTLTQAIAHRDTLVGQHSLLQHAITHAQKGPDRYSMAEIKWVATLNVAGLQKQLEDVAKKVRELNTAIQQANWIIELDE